MRVWNGIGSYPDDAQPVVASVGNYDGVHLGHQEILGRVTEDARRRGSGSLLITFEPHPVAVVAPERRPRLLQTRMQKLDQLEECGLTDVLILEFDQQVAALSGEAFFGQLLAETVPLAAIHVGESFRFGHNRQGDLALLREIGRRHGFEVHGVPAVELNGQAISSSAIRRALADGDVDLAAAMLGRPFALIGVVVRGDGRGRDLQCPTANLDCHNETLPREGVYVTETVALAARIPSVTNIGNRPTVSGKQVVVETHLLEFDEDLYGERLEVRFLARLRDEQRFAGLSELADQLARDRAAAESFFRNRRLSAP